ncbi:hypothetical protein, partial [Vreelandella titanicae]|uniref:hypothetical protein n=1 Tax=Vreelandella titanicae TaxID=664683 RepID=UPI00241E8428
MAEVPLGVVPTPPAGAYERSLNSRSSLPRATDVHEVESVGFVARRKRQRTRGSSAKRCRSLAEVPLGVVPMPPAGAYERSLNSLS